MSAPTWALTVPQPAAWAIAHGYQDVYNRPYSTDVRGWIAISAGAAVDAELMHVTSRLTGRAPEAIEAACTERSKIVAVARLVGVCEEQPCECGPWANKRFIHWKLADAIALPEPVPAPHIFGIWKMSGVLAARVAHEWQAARGAPHAGQRPAPEPRKDSPSLRDELLPLPGAAEGYRHVLLLGTRGAGKTTVIRQLLGTDPDTERFPSTSASKTTVADTELILTREPRFRAVVTFAGRDEIADHLRDNVWEAAKAVFEGRPDAVVHDKLLDHVSQRFRFSYLLGRSAPPVPAGDDLDDLDVLDDEEPLDADGSGNGLGETGAPAPGRSDPRTAALIQNAVEAIHHVVGTELKAVQAEITTGEKDRSIEEIVEDELENRIRRSPVCIRIVATLLGAIEERFGHLTVGDLHRGEDGWPESWTWDTSRAVADAIGVFHHLWSALLGLSYDAEVRKQHWATIKALTRRLSEGHVDEYRDLRPAASLRTGLENALYRMIQDPVRWTGPEPDDDEQQVVFDGISRGVTKRLVPLVDRLVTEGPRADWLRAYEEHGTGSTFRRAQIVADDVYVRAVPPPDNANAGDDQFTQAVHAAFEEVAAELDFLLD